MAAIAELPPLLRRYAVLPTFLLQRSAFHRPPFMAFASTNLLPLAVPIFSNLSGFLSSLWNSILLAVPKKKTSYSKKRSRQLAGKGLKDLKNLNRCSACGRVKRMHTLCSHCVQNIKDMWANRLIEPKSKRTDSAKSRDDSATR